MSDERLRGASVVLHSAPVPGDEQWDPVSGDPRALAVLEHRLARLHGTEAALVTADRLAALALVATARAVPGDSLVCADQLGGETYGFLADTCGRLGLDVRFISSPWELERWEERIDERTQLLFAECPSDPNLFIPDLEALAALAADHCLPLVVDTTVATPIVCRAAGLGADLVVCSLAGDLTGNRLAAGGAVLGREEAIVALQEAAERRPGCRLPPQAAVPCLLGLETVYDRLRTKRESTLAVRSYLLERRAEGEVTFVNHPSLRKHPQHGLAKRHLGGFGGALISFGVRGGEAAARAFVRGLRLVEMAAHPGGSRSTICHPWSMTHAGLSEAQREAAVIRANVLRLCIGNEDPADVLADLERGFDAL